MLCSFFDSQVVISVVCDIMFEEGREKFPEKALSHIIPELSGLLMPPRMGSTTRQGFLENGKSCIMRKHD